jgi:aspartokinase-like uncharacterized kinase
MRNPSPAPEIVKLGGSLIRSPRLSALLACLVRAGAPLVIVPGGGPFADTVRAAQPILGFSDETAHRMAILAMEQTAFALADIEPRLMPCAEEPGIVEAHAAGHAALWLPVPLALDADVPASWEVTSDSLAAWLAIRLKAARLTLIKSAEVEAPDGPPQLWADDGLVDEHFPSICQRFGGAVRAISLDGALHGEFAA